MELRKGFRSLSMVTIRLITSLLFFTAQRLKRLLVDDIILFIKRQSDDFNGSSALFYCTIPVRK